MAEEQTLGGILKDMWSGRRYLLLGGTIGLALGFLVIWAAVPQYKATMLIGPTTRSGGVSDLASLLPNSSGFAFEYVLRSLGPSDSSDFMRFEHILREATVASHLLEEERIGKGIRLARRFGFTKNGQPETPEQLAAYLRKNLKIEPVGMTPMRRLVYLHPDPDFAVFLVHRVFAVADGLIRDEMKRKTQKRVDYLNKVLDTAEHPDHREVLVSLLMEQEHVRMILAMDEAYAAAIAEPASVSGKPYWPRKPLVFAVLIMIGIFLGYTVYATHVRESS